MRWLWLVLALAGCGSLFDPGHNIAINPDSVSPIAPPPLSAGPFTLGVGDRVRVSVWRNAELDTEVPVRPDGKISMPLVGEMKVAGMTPQSVSVEVTAALRHYLRDPIVAVVVTHINEQRYQQFVRLMGAVQQPRLVPWREGLTLLDSVLEAGGIDAGASLRTVQWLRAGTAPKTLDMRDLWRGRSLQPNPVLHPGDVVHVPRALLQ